MKHSLTRRRFLQASGVSIALPLLESTMPRARAGDRVPPRRRIVAVLYSLGLYPTNFFPEQTGADYTMSRYLKLLQDYRKDFTVFSGLSHPNVVQGHAESESVFLTGCPI